MLRASEARCDNTCQKKPERGVSEIARDMKNFFTSRCGERRATINEEVGGVYGVGLL